MSRKVPFIREVKNAQCAAGAVSLFAVQWYRSRQPSRLLYAVPALVLGVAFVWSMIASRSLSRRDALLRDYLDLAREAIRQNDTPAARLSFRRAQSLSFGSQEITFEFASGMYEMGHQDEAFQIMAGLAPLKKTGYLPAHRFLVDNAKPHDPHKADLFRAVHLGHIIRGSRDSRPERLQLLTILARYRSFDRAEQLLRETLEQYPEDLITLARLKAKSGKIADARQTAERACLTLYRMLEATPSNVNLRIQLAQGHVFLGEFGAALEVLADGVCEEPPAELLDAISATYTHWLSLLNESQKAEQQACLQRLLVRSGHSTTQNDSKLDPAELALLLQDRIRTDRSGGILPLLIGSASAAAGDLVAAERHLRKALESDPADPSIKNNLSWVLLNRARSEKVTETSATLLKEAVAYSDEAVAQMPEITSFRETRGQLRSMLGRHAEGVSDLNECLNAGFESREIHQTLSNSLRALNRMEEARFHAEIANHFSAAHQTRR